MADSEYIAKIKSVAEEVTGIRNTSGNTAMTIMFGVLSVLKSKNKITEKDLEIIFQIEKDQAAETLNSYFEKAYGNDTFPLQNKAELDDTQQVINGYVDRMFEYVMNAAEEIKPTRKKKGTNNDS